MEAKKLFNGRTILLVEDDKDLRTVVTKVLEGQGAHVRQAENGLVAKTIMGLNDHRFDLVLSDVRMPEMDGIALLRYAKNHHAQVPFLIFTGFAEALEAKQAFELGANGFLAKPFKLAELLRSITDLIFPKPATSEAPKVPLANEFCKVPVDDFLSASRLASDVYVMVAGERFIKVAHENTEIELGRIQIYKEKKVDFFYVKTADFGKYVGLNLTLSRAAKDSERVEPEKKLMLFKHTAEILTQQIFVHGIEESLCSQVGLMVENTLKVLGENDDLMGLLLAMQSEGDKIYAHSVGVAVYSVMLAKKMGWNTSANHYKLTLASLFHDIGMKELPPALREKSRAKMTQEEMRMYESHPVRSRDLLLDCRDFPGDLTQIVFQHHENQQGTGYPNGLSPNRIHPLARVIRVADEFVEHLVAHPKATQVEVQTILNRMHELKSGEFDAQVLGAAFEIFGLPRPANLKKRVA